jgi:hypothetical protein
MKSETYAQILERAQVELWIEVRSYRLRYIKLRESIRALRYATIAFLVVLIALVIDNLILHIWP